MRYFPAQMTSEASDLFAERIRRSIDDRGWGLWAVEVIDETPFIGFVGLNEATFAAHFTPAVEVGWRLARTAWGNGYATEAARAAIAYGFDDLELDEIVSFTTVANLPSRRVMEKLGMSRDRAGDFDHPLVDEVSPIRPHVLYRLRRQDWIGSS